MAVPGYYGKFPALGDFVNRRLPSQFVEPWDEWLQMMVATSQDQLGEQWLDLYLTSPIWKFVLGSGLCGEHPWCGLLMPSVDRVGRYYPLTLASKLALNANPVQVATQAEGWFQSAEKVLLSALDEAGCDMEHFDVQVTELDALDKLPHLGASASQVGFGTAWQIPFPKNNSVAELMPSVLHQLLLQRLGDYSIWWSSGSYQVEPSFLLCAEMPTPEQFSAMLTGDWGMGQWETWPSILDDETALDPIEEDELTSQ